MDLYLVLLKVEKLLNELEKFEFKLFKVVINDGLYVIMLVYINFIYLIEDGLLVILFKCVLIGLLCEEMGFEGLIIIDGIEMKVIYDNYGIIEVILKIVNVGVNLVCICYDLFY